MAIFSHVNHAHTRVIIQHVGAALEDGYTLAPCVFILFIKILNNVEILH